VGTAGAIGLILTGWAGEFVAVFGLLGAIFGPVCGAMAADYLLAGRRWAGPRAGFNPAGWISWAAGFTVGAWTDKFLAGLFHSRFQTPCAPLAAILVGFAVYILVAKLGLESRRLEMPAA
jgi:cytosine permease